MAAPVASTGERGVFARSCHRAWLPRMVARTRGALPAAPPAAVASTLRCQGAWQVSDAVLAAVGLTREEEVLAFAAADILYTKVRYDFKQLPRQARLPFRDSVLAHMRKFIPMTSSSPTHPAFPRLCLVVACLCVRIDEWRDPIRSVVELLGLAPNTLPAVFTVFECIVEEVRHKCMPMYSKSRLPVQATGAPPPLVRLLLRPVVRCSDLGPSHSRGGPRS